MSNSSIVRSEEPGRRTSWLPGSLFGLSGRYREIAGRALRWWLDELSSMSPQLLAKILKRHTEPALSLIYTRESSTLLIPRSVSSGPTTLPIGSDSDSSFRSHVDTILRSRRLSSTVVVKLDPGLVHEGRITLPLAAEASLRQIVAHQIERLVPLPSDEVVTVPQVVRRSPNLKSFEVRVSVTKKTTVARALELARGNGLIPILVTSHVYGSGAAGSTFWRGGHRRKGHAYVLRLLEIFAVALVVSAYGLHIHRLDQIRDALSAEIASERQEAESIQATARALDQASAAMRFFADRRSSISPLRILNELTQIVPITSWVTQLSIDSKSIELTGISAHATELIPLLEASKIFGKPQFRSPITQTLDGSRERFSLVLTLLLHPATQ